MLVLIVPVNQLFITPVAIIFCLIFFYIVIKICHFFFRVIEFLHETKQSLL